MRQLTFPLRTKAFYSNGHINNFRSKSYFSRTALILSLSFLFLSQEALSQQTCTPDEDFVIVTVDAMGNLVYAQPGPLQNDTGEECCDGTANGNVDCVAISFILPVALDSDCLFTTIDFITDQSVYVAFVDENNVCSEITQYGNNAQVSLMSCSGGSQSIVICKDGNLTVTPIVNVGFKCEVSLFAPPIATYCEVGDVPAAPVITTTADFLALGGDFSTTNLAPSCGSCGVDVDDLTNWSVMDVSTVVDRCVGGTYTRTYSATYCGVQISAEQVFTIDPDVCNLCCEFLVSCPTFTPDTTLVSCLSDIPSAVSLTEMEFEALGDGNGVIGDNSCDVVTISASNSQGDSCDGSTITRTYTVTEAGNNSPVACTQEFRIENSGPALDCSNTLFDDQTVMLFEDIAALITAIEDDLAANTSGAVTMDCDNQYSVSYSDLTETDNCDSIIYTVTFTIIESNCQPVRTASCDVDFILRGRNLGCEVEAWKLIHISLGNDCMATVTASAGGVGIEPECNDYYTVNLYTHHLDPIPDNKLDVSFLGDTIIFEIVEPECGNSSWGKGLVEDKWDPTIECVNDTISCLDGLDVAIKPAFSDNCGAILELRNQVFHNLDCHDEFTGYYIRTWVAVDFYGNESDPCDQIVYLRRTLLDNIIPPPSYWVGNNNPLECASGYAKDINGNPHPSVTGVPILDGVDLYPFIANAICNGYIEYDDKISLNNGCIKRITRTWTIGEWWCRPIDEKTFVQIIDIVDTTPPEILNELEDITISTGSRDCEGNVDLPPIQYRDACGNNVHVNLLYNGIALIGSNGGNVYLPVGKNKIKYKVWDICGNEDSTSMEVLVVDRKNPVVICDIDLAVSLNSNGVASIKATDIDKGSFDECSDLTYEARRMDDPCGVSGTDWSEKVYFCCEDVGTSVMIAMRITDESRNTNICMVEVEVQDKIPPRMRCIDNVTIDCNETYALNNLKAFFGFPTMIQDNCPANNRIQETFVESTNQCGIGSIHRTFILYDHNDNFIQQCDQWITITSDNSNGEFIIDWPDDYDANNICTDEDLDPDNLPEGFGLPLISDDFCTLIGVKYDDELFEITDGDQACFKIIRTWKVIDWCGRNERNDNDEFPVIEYEQTIKVTNTNDPELTGDCSDREFLSYDVNCSDLEVTLSMSATDDCTDLENLLVSYEIDLDDDGNVDNSGVDTTVTDVYPIGIHSIRWEVMDRCGNTATCTYIFEVINAKEPTPICLNGVSVDLVAMDTDDVQGTDTAMAFFRPHMIDAKSEHSCGYDVTLSFSSDPDDTLRILGCDDIGDRWFELWVTDSNGNQSFCYTTVTITANGDEGFCDGPMIRNVNIEGSVSNHSQETMTEVEVTLKGSELPNDMTEGDGQYAFPNMPMGGSYEIIPKKNSDPLNGVSTLDIVMIQRHLLGISEITSPYLLLAADINKSGSITASDIIELRKLILGHYEALPHNDSWRFIDADYSFIDPQFPWGEEAPETYRIENLSSDMNVDFVGLKVGDISGDATANLREESFVSRSNTTWRLGLTNTFVEAGDFVRVPVRSDGKAEIVGWQLELVTEGFSVIGIDKGSVDIASSHYIITETGFRMSYNNADEIENTDVLFTIALRANESGYIRDLFNISNDYFNSEAYGASGIELFNLDIEWIEEPSSEFTLLQNIPNPWSDHTTVEFEIPHDGPVTLNINDISGRQLRKIVGYYKAGINSVVVRSDELQVQGVLIYELVHDGKRLHKRMIKMK